MAACIATSQSRDESRLNQAEYRFESEGSGGRRFREREWLGAFRLPNTGN